MIIKKHCTLSAYKRVINLFIQTSDYKYKIKQSSRANLGSNLHDYVSLHL